MFDDPYIAQTVEDRLVTADMNCKFIEAITRPDCTVGQYQRALHEYLTDPRRKEKVECYCTQCRRSR